MQCWSTRTHDARAPQRKCVHLFILLRVPCVLAYAEAIASDQRVRGFCRAAPRSRCTQIAQAFVRRRSHVSLERTRGARAYFCVRMSMITNSRTRARRFARSRIIHLFAPAARTQSCVCGAHHAPMHCEQKARALTMHINTFLIEIRSDVRRCGDRGGFLRGISAHSSPYTVLFIFIF